MNGYLAITDALSELRGNFDWAHSFIRELYFLTMHSFSRYRDADAVRIGDSDGPLNLRMVIAATGHSTIFGIEFLCLDVQAFSLQRLDELSFECKCDTDLVTLDFGNKAINSEDCWLVCKRVLVAFLDEVYLGPALRLGYKIPELDLGG